MSDTEEVYGIVLDFGSSTSKVGFAGSDAPAGVFASRVGKTIIKDKQQPDTFVGDLPQTQRQIESLNYPIQHGIVTNWDDMEDILNYTFEKQLRISPKDYIVTTSEPLYNPRSHREFWTQIMFEKYEVPNYFIALQPMLSHYSSGRVISLSVDCGHQITQVLPVYEGHVVECAAKRMEFGGADVTSYLEKLLRKKGHSFSTCSEMETVKDMKESLCYVSSHFENESSTDRIYELPDGNTVDVGEERYRCPEGLFQPSLIDRPDEEGIHEMICNCLQACDIDTRLDLYCNVILSGGTSLTPGFKERLQMELVKRLPSTTRVRVVATPERRYFVWIGGSILGSLSYFKTMTMSKSEYEEHGPCHIHRKVFL